MKTSFNGLKNGLGLILLACGLAACSGEYSGGGVIPSASGVEGEKATFGFTIYAENDGLDCNEITSVRGQLQYVDHGTGVAFHAKITDFAGIYADDEGNFTPLFIGDYYIKGKKQGNVLVAVIDYNDSKTDLFFVTVLDGPYQDYVNQGTFDKGNITYQPDALCL